MRLDNERSPSVSGISSFLYFTEPTDGRFFERSGLQAEAGEVRFLRKKREKRRAAYVRAWIRTYVQEA